MFCVAYMFGAGGSEELSNALGLLQGLADTHNRKKDELSEQHRALDQQRKEVEKQIEKRKLNEDRLMRKVSYSQTAALPHHCP